MLQESDQKFKNGKKKKRLDIYSCLLTIENKIIILFNTNIDRYEITGTVSSTKMYVYICLDNSFTFSINLRSTMHGTDDSWL